MLLVIDVIEKNKLRMNKLAADRPRLAEQVDALDWDELQAAVEECIFKKEEGGLPETYGPASYFPLKPESQEQEALYAHALEHGEDLVQAGKTAAFTVAGGQGTRLGYDGPKGTLAVSPIKKKPLFQLFAEQNFLETRLNFKPLLSFSFTFENVSFEIPSSWTLWVLFQEKCLTLVKDRSHFL